MPRKFEKVSGQVIGEIKEEFGIISEDDKSDWVTGLVSISWSEHDPKIEIRQYNKTKLSDDDPKVASRGFRKGISLTEDELNNLAELLVQLGYGDSRNIRVSLKERKQS